MWWVLKLWSLSPSSCHRSELTCSPMSSAWWLCNLLTWRATKGRGSTIFISSNAMYPPLGTRLYASAQNHQMFVCISACVNIHPSIHSHMYIFNRHSPIHFMRPHCCVFADSICCYWNTFPLYFPVEILQIYMSVWIGNLKTRKHK